MPEFPETSESLIARVRDPSNRAAWEEFEEVYRPVIFRIARARGMQYSDAQDLVQQVLFSVATAIGRYEKRNGGPRFRNWLSRVTRNAIVKALARAPRVRAIGGSDVIDVLADIPASDPETDALIELEYRREIYLRAATNVRREVQETTWLAFDMTALNGKPIDHVAKTLSLSTGTVYAARSRIMRMLRDYVEELTKPEVEGNAS